MQYFRKLRGVFMKVFKEILLSKELLNIYKSMRIKAIYLHNSLWMDNEIDESSEAYEWLKIKTTIHDIKENFRKKQKISNEKFCDTWEILVKAELVVDNQDGTFTLPYISIR